MAVTFVTPCMNRLYHLSQTVVANLEKNKEAEFILLDVSSNDGMTEWANKNLKGNKRVSLYRATGETYYNAAKAKNMVHKLASSDIVVNLDADISLSEGFDLFVADMFKRSGANTVLTSTKMGPTGGGIIGVSAAQFEELGGYDEAFVHGWGYEDVDFLSRCIRAGMTRRTFDPSLINVIAHTDKERETNLGVSLDECRRLHQKIFNMNNKVEITHANIDGVWGKGNVKRVW